LKVSIQQFFAPTWRAVVAGLVSVALLIASYPPSQLGWLAWFGLAPLFLATQRRRRVEMYIVTIPWAFCYIAGLADSYWWTRSPIFVLVLLVGVLVRAIMVSEIQLLAQRFPRCGWILVPAVWTSVLFLISLVSPLPLDAPLLTLANTQWLYPVVLQTLSVTGVYGLIFLIVLVNSGIAETIKRLGQRRWWPPIVVVLTLVVIYAMWGVSELARAESKHTIGIAIAPTGGSLVTEPSAITMTREFVDWVESNPIPLPNGSILPRLEIIVWGELPLGDLDDTETLMQVGDLASELERYLVANFYADQPNGTYLNMAVVFGPDGSSMAQNAKRVIPPVVEHSTPGDRHLPPEIVTTPWGRMTTLICYETFFPTLVRRVARNRVDFFVVPASAVRQAPRFTAIHLAQTIFRAVENHTAITFSYAGGLSALIDANGRLLIHSPWETLTSTIDTHIASALPIGSGGTLYTRVGDVFALVILLASIGWIASAKGRRNWRLEIGL